MKRLVSTPLLIPIAPRKCNFHLCNFERMCITVLFSIFNFQQNLEVRHRGIQEERKYARRNSDLHALYSYSLWKCMRFVLKMNKSLIYPTDLPSDLPTSHKLVTATQGRHIENHQKPVKKQDEREKTRCWRNSSSKKAKCCHPPTQILDNSPNHEHNFRPLTVPRKHPKFR